MTARSNAVRLRLQRHYDRLWSGAIERIRGGDIELDPVLAAGLPDRRRGLTVIAGPSVSVCARIGDIIDHYRTLEPGQHYYTPDRLHVTVLSLFTATVEAELYLVHAEQYRAAVAAAMQKAEPFQIEFTGITASPAALMVQGFFEDEALNGIRDGLRRELRVRKLPDTQRYHLQAAHVTICRFCKPLREPAAFAARLEEGRGKAFGNSNIKRLMLVENDWYMNHRVLKRYPLKLALPHGLAP